MFVNLDHDRPVLPQIRAALLAALVSARDAPPRGCLLGNTAVELAPDDARATELVRSGFTVIEDAFRAALDQARAAGEIADRGDTGAQARMLLALMQGLQVVARAEVDPTRLADAVDAALATFV